MKTRIEELIKSMSEVFEGQPWYGHSVMRKLENVPHKIGYATCVPESHTVAEIVGHILAWKTFALEKLRENNNFDIKINSHIDWPSIEVKSSEEWENLKRKLVSVQFEIYEQLRTYSDSFLDKSVPGRAYTFEHLIKGLIQHDIYHLGQIGLIESQLKKNDTHLGVFSSKSAIE